MLLVLLTLHMVAQHFVVPSGLRWYEDVIDWLSNPIVVAIEVAFLVVRHVPRPARRAGDPLRLRLLGEDRAPHQPRIFVVVGIATVAYGVALLAAIINNAQ